MLPGFRFLFAAMVLSLSILIFGFGAAALLHAAHEEFVSAPSWRKAPESRFAQQPEDTGPVLAMLRLEPAAAVQEPETMAIASGAEEPDVANTPAQTEPDRLAVLRPENSPAAETAKPELAVTPEATQADDKPARAEAPAAVDDVKIAQTEPAVPPDEKMASAPDAASTKIATLAGPSLVKEVESPNNALRESVERPAFRKRARARRPKKAAHRHRVGPRARTAARQAPQQPAFPFAAPAPAVNGG